jgi:hypothetical protein
LDRRTRRLLIVCTRVRARLSINAGHLEKSPGIQWRIGSTTSESALQNDAPANELRYPARGGSPFPNTFRQYNRELESNSYSPQQKCQEENLSMDEERRNREASCLALQRRGARECAGVNKSWRESESRRVTDAAAPESRCFARENCLLRHYAFTNSTQIPPARRTLCMGVNQSSRRQARPTSSQILANSRRL